MTRPLSASYQPAGNLPPSEPRKPSNLPPFAQRKPSKPSLTRSQSSRRRRLVQELQRGRPSALKHGVFAEVSNFPDVATEIALTFAAHGHLDPIADARLVEQYAIALTQQRKAIVAMAGGMSSVLTSYESRLSALAERLERAVHERDRERSPSRSAASSEEILSRYRPQPLPPKETR